VISAAVDASTAARVEAIAHSALETAAGLDTVYAHGDFCPTNLLVEEGRLSGVIDWEGASAQRLPLLDLYHLLVLNTPYPDVYEWGSAVVTQLVPFARAGGNDQTKDYLDGLGLSLGAGTMSALVALYWLHRIEYQLAMYASRSADDRWLRRNVVEPALALSD
jgi:aminoglycoside phosphotransferase (APT) family kinase protein